ncbi:MAG: hypothetical protein IPO92_22335 [Saprospiraceae bacterium]|nr:hypothetical protein [Saprospiraceae bacterium]
MKKVNFLAKTFLLLMVVMISAQFTSLNAQSFVSEQIAVQKLSIKLEQLNGAPSASISFPDKGVFVVADPKNITRKQFYSLVLQNLQGKDQSGLPMHTTKGAYDAAKSLFVAKYANVVPDRRSDGSVLAWMYAEAFNFLTN